MLNFISKNMIYVCFLSCYISPYLIASILPLDPQSLKYLQSEILYKMFSHFVLVKETDDLCSYSCF